jgi:polyhydroxyalkanoate synthase subunit PhaC
MQSTMNSVRWCFETIDKTRRRRGAAMDKAGLGPALTPSRVILERPGMRLLSYNSADGNTKHAPGVDAPVALIIPAPIKRHYIWDLLPQRSAVQRLLRHGMAVYLVEWTDPEGEAARHGLDDYGHTLIDTCVDAIGSDVFLFSHSLGGVFATVYAALKPARVRGLTVIESPLHFGPSAGSFVPMLAFGPTAKDITRNFDAVPGSVLNVASVSASPTSFGMERVADFIHSMKSPDDMLGHLLVERWTLDEAPMSPRLFEQVLEWLYREDRFMQGKLEIGGRAIGPRDVVVPFLAVLDPRSLIIPPESMIAFQDAAGSSEICRLEYHGDVGIGLAHVGALVGPNAHRVLWPAMLQWVDKVVGEEVRA